MTMRPSLNPQFSPFAGEIKRGWKAQNLGLKQGIKHVILSKQ